ncbi:MAG: DegT/DnrJ/EryC1/StrS family aminotransferase [Bdellovibrionales bacterium]|nr:DegT/DnrJ/EryC1/StrS family aminotransferase [Bdellovibrionales bacterium]
MEKIYAAGPSITQVEIDCVLDAMKTGWYEKPYNYVEDFQNEFAQWHGRKFGVMTPNCTTAIHLLLTALKIKKGDEVIAPEITWIGSTAGITYVRATPVLTDILPTNWCIDPDQVEKNITKNTKAIIAVDLFGNMAEMDRLCEISKMHQIPLIEDAAEALGSKYKGVRAGKFGVASVFSFHRTKTLTTGEGGMILTDDKNLYDRCMVLRDHGRRPGGQTYFNEEITCKYMPFNLQAALGHGQFKRIHELIEMKRWTLRKYKEFLSGIDGLQFNEESADVENGAWITGLVFSKKLKMTKDFVISELAKFDIPIRPFFYPLSSLPAYNLREKYEHVNVNSYEISSRGINLPGAMNITEGQIEFIAEKLRGLIDRAH